MREKATQRCEQLKLVYGDALEAQGVKELREANALGVSQSYVNNCQNIDHPANLYAALIPDSHVKVELMEHLAKECGGVFVRHAGESDGDATQEFVGVIELCAQALKSKDNASRLKKITQAMKLLEKGRQDIA
jgi:hypothetical protein